MSEEVYWVNFWGAGMDSNCVSEGDHWDTAQTAWLFSWLGSKASLNRSMFWHLDCYSKWGNNSEAVGVLWKKPPFDIFCSKQVLGGSVPDCLKMFPTGDKLFSNNFNFFLSVFHLASSHFLSSASKWWPKMLFVPYSCPSSQFILLDFTGKCVQAILKIYLEWDLAFEISNKKSLFCLLLLPMTFNLHLRCWLWYWHIHVWVIKKMGCFS